LKNADEILNFQGTNEFSKSYGYVVSGQVLFVDDSSKPLGLAIKDEFVSGTTVFLLTILPSFD